MAKKDESKRGKTSTYRNLSENWKTIVAEGAIALVIGVVIVAVPNLSEKVVRYLLGGFLIVYAVLSIVAAGSAGKESEPTAWLYVRGVIAGAGGLVIMFWPGLTKLTLLYILAVFAIVAGVIVGVTGIFQKWDKTYKAIAGFGGIASVVFGIILISYSSSLADPIIWITGVFAMLFGLMMILLGAGARGIGKKTE
jgi:uncharacterized membrane protein HdeD (DUF308 family)